jgi:hypothetical protein
LRSLDALNTLHNPIVPVITHTTIFANQILIFFSNIYPSVIITALHRKDYKVMTIYKPFIITLVPTILYCLISLMYCWINGQAMMSTHLDPHYAWRFLQCIIATIIATFLFFTRAKCYWYFIPLTLVVTAHLYVLIVNQYPCCVGG